MCAVIYGRRCYTSLIVCSRIGGLTVLNIFLPHHLDDGTARQWRILVLITLACLGSAMFLVLFGLVVPRLVPVHPFTIGLIMVYLLALMLIKAKQVQAAIILVVGVLIVTRLTIPLLPAFGSLPGLDAALAVNTGIIVVTAAFLLRWWAIIPTVSAIILGQYLITTLSTAASAPQPLPIGALIVFSVVVGVFAQSLEAALHRAQHEEQATQAQATRANMLNADLETSLRETQALLSKERTLRETISQLTVPVQDLGRNVLFVPLIGHIDAERGTTLTTTILTRLHGARARTIIIDLQGVAVIDTQVAQMLNHLTQAIQLLGAAAIFTGISADTAATITRVGITFRDVAIYPSVGAALDALAEPRHAA